MIEIVEYFEWAPCLPHIRMLLTSKYMWVFHKIHGVNCALEWYHWFGVLGHVPLLVVVGHYSVAIQLLYLEMNVDFKHSCINRCIINIPAATNACLKVKLLIMCIFTICLSNRPWPRRRVVESSWNNCLGRPVKISPVIYRVWHTLYIVIMYHLLT